jgi:hypothetical protein
VEFSFAPVNHKEMFADGQDPNGRRQDSRVVLLDRGYKNFGELREAEVRSNSFHALR